METPLHAQKVAILSRLVKESTLTLEEALLLLKEEIEEPTPSIISTNPGITHIAYPWNYPISGTTTATVTTTSGAISVTNNTTSHANT